MCKQKVCHVWCYKKQRLSSEESQSSDCVASRRHFRLKALTSQRTGRRLLSIIANTLPRHSEATDRELRNYAVASFVCHVHKNMNKRQSSVCVFLFIKHRLPTTRPGRSHALPLSDRLILSLTCNCLSTNECDPFFLRQYDLNTSRFCIPITNRKKY